MAKYTNEFKLQAVKAVTEDGQSYSVVAKSLGIPVQTLRNWVANFKKHGKVSLPAGGLRPSGGRPSKGTKIPVSMRLLVEDNDRLDRLAESTGKTKVDVVRDALVIYERLPPEQCEKLIKKEEENS